MQKYKKNPELPKQFGKCCNHAASQGASEWYNWYNWYNWYIKKIAHAGLVILHGRQVKKRNV